MSALLAASPVWCSRSSPTGAVQMNFVKTVRAVELVLGIPIPGVAFSSKITTTNFTAAMSATVTAMGNGNSTGASASNIFTPEVTAALQDAVPILVEMALELSIPTIFNFASTAAPVHNQREPLVTKSAVIPWSIMRAN